MNAVVGAPRADCGWAARLDLAFVERGPRTALFSRHVGPLRVQKTLYPEGGRCAHAIIIHPPGGIAGGDSLELEMDVAARTQALITTPGAAKWYGSTGPAARQAVNIALHGELEWLPQETIVFNHAQASTTLHIRASAAGAMIGWETIVFGRRASGERFDCGVFSQHIALEIEGVPVWEDRLLLRGDDPLFSSPIGLRGQHSLATVWALRPSGAAWGEDDIAALRQHSPAIAWTRLAPTLLVGRMLGTPLQLQSAARSAWQALRPMTLQREPQAPRIWAT